MPDVDRLIEQIRELNPTAGREWLAGFTMDELEQYLRHLVYAAEPRGGSTAWLRPEGSRPFVHRTAAA